MKLITHSFCDGADNCCRSVTLKSGSGSGSGRLGLGLAQTGCGGNWDGQSVCDRLRPDL